MENSKKILVDEENELFEKQGMFFKEFPSDFRQIRYFTLLIVQKAPPEIKEINLLEQQISEVIKNAIKHGNKSNIEKKIRIWYSFSKHKAKIIVEDEGEGFKELEKWNDFNAKRTECFLNQNFEEMEKYLAFRTAASDDNDGGNALFATVEYWDGGVVFNKKKNCIAVMKHFKTKQFPINN